MVEKERSISWIWWWGFLAGLGFRKKAKEENEKIEKVKYIIDQQKRDTRRIEEQKQTVKREEKKQRMTEWRKGKKKSRYIDINTNPQRLKKNWYHGYDVANRVANEDPEKEINKYQYGE